MKDKKREKAMMARIEQTKMTQAQELVFVEQKFGALSPANVVAWAKENPESQIHKAMVWDDSKAAELYRLEQARGIIRISVKVIEVKNDPIKIGVKVVDNKPIPCSVRSHFPLEKSKDGNTIYHPIENILCDESKRKMLLETAMSELQSFKRKYVMLSELSQVFSAIDEVLKKEA